MFNDAWGSSNILHSTKQFNSSCCTFLLFVFVDQMSNIIECNYCYWGIVLFYLQNRKIHKSTFIIIKFPKG